MGLVSAQQANAMTQSRKQGMIRVAHRVGALWLLASEWGGHLVVPRVVDRGLEAEAIPSATGHHAAHSTERECV